MIDNSVSLDLIEFVERNILPRYNDFDRAHSLNHVTGVIRRSLEIAKVMGADMNMAYTIAAYHDLGLSGPRAIHHLTGGKILSSDARLKKWFTPDQIRIMREAVEDHRASASHAPRSVYGKIVAEADRDLDPESVFRRTIQFGLSNYPELNDEQQWNRFLNHMNEKYSEQGYIRLWIQNSPNGEKLKAIRDLLRNPKELRRVFDTLCKEERQK
jgi:uncharacterized protein